MPFSNYTNFADCVRQNPQARDPEAYCGSIKHKVENKAARGHLVDISGKPASSPEHSHKHRKGTRLTHAVKAADPLYQAVRLSLLSVVTKRDPVKEEGDKKLKEADGVAADGAQDDQAFAVAYGPDNYDKLTKRAIARYYSPVFKATRRIIHNITTERSFR